MHIRKCTVSLMECVLFFIIEKSINSMLTHCDDALHILHFRITLPYMRMLKLYSLLFRKSFTSIRKHMKVSKSSPNLCTEVKLLSVIKLYKISTAPNPPALSHIVPSECAQVRVASLALNMGRS